ncbi:MAG TPA: DUF3631 domain-containing protein [Candidatus Angelobacter sp.]
MDNQTQAASNPTPEPWKMLVAIARFLEEYLACSDEQRTILALWIVHVWCYRAFPTTPYLNIQSPGPQCGKSRRLQLLHLLSPPRSWLACGPTPNAFMKRMLALKFDDTPEKASAEDLPSAVFLDDREFTLGSSSQHPIVSLLKSSARTGGRYLYQPQAHDLHEFTGFCPKAFAGIRQLPRPLADCCIPILLQRKKRSETVKPMRETSLSIKPLRAWLESWSRENAENLALTAAHGTAPRIPEQLSPRQRESAEPLVFLADRLAGPWPERIRSAVYSIFHTLADPDPLADGVELLADLRDAFHHKHNPPYIPTSELLPWLQNLDYRSWINWGKAPANDLARFLRPFGIYSRNQRTGPDSVIKAYYHDDFTDAWSRYL